MRSTKKRTDSTDANVEKKTLYSTNTYVLGSLGSNYIDFGKGEGKSPKSCSL